MPIRASKLILTLFVLFAVLGLLILLYHLVFPKPLIPSVNYEGSPTKITVASIGEFSIYNYIAMKEDLFKKYGLEVEVIEYADGPSAVSDLIDGKVDFATAADFVGVTKIFASEDLRIVAQQNTHESFEMVGLKEKGIRIESDLKGKKIGVTKNGVGEFFLGRFLTFNNLTIQDVKVVDLSPQDIVAKLETGEIDAAVIFNPHVYRLEQKMNEKLVIWPAQENQKIFAMLYSTDSFLSGNSDVAEKYLYALIEAEKFIKQNEKESKEILAKALNYEAEYVDHIWGNFDYTIGLDQALLISMEDQARFALTNKLTSKTEVPNYLNYINFKALEKAKPQRITIIR